MPSKSSFATMMAPLSIGCMLVALVDRASAQQSRPAPGLPGPPSRGATNRDALLDFWAQWAPPPIPEYVLPTYNVPHWNIPTYTAPSIATTCNFPTWTAPVIPSCFQLPHLHRSDHSRVHTLCRLCPTGGHSTSRAPTTTAIKPVVTTATTAAMRTAALPRTMATTASHWASLTLRARPILCPRPTFRPCLTWRITSIPGNDHTMECVLSIC